MLDSAALTVPRPLGLFKKTERIFLLVLFFCAFTQSGQKNSAFEYGQKFSVKKTDRVTNK